MFKYPSDSEYFAKSNIYSNAPLQMMQTIPLNIIWTEPRWARLWEMQPHDDNLLFRCNCSKVGKMVLHFPVFRNEY